MTTENSYPVFLKLLQKGLSLSRQFNTLLSTECEILTHNNQADSLLELAKNKHQLISELNQFTIQLSHFLTQKNLPTGPDGVKKYLENLRESNSNADELSEMWNEITSLTENCRFLNEKNGASIELLSRHVFRSLQILNGDLQSTNTYGPDGIKKNDISSHSLASV